MRVLFKVQNMSMGRQEAYEIFKRDYFRNNEIEEQKAFLKKSYSEAKQLGEIINNSRNKLSKTIIFLNIKYYKALIIILFFSRTVILKDNLKLRSEQIYAKLEASNALDNIKQNSEYESLRKTMEYEKEKYITEQMNFY